MLFNLIYSSQNPSGLIAIINYILHMRKLIHRELKYLTQDRIARNFSSSCLRNTNELIESDVSN